MFVQSRLGCQLLRLSVLLLLVPLAAGLSSHTGRQPAGIAALVALRMVLGSWLTSQQSLAMSVCLVLLTVAEYH